jgi:hypothetical protein
MKNITRFNICLAMAAIILTAALAVPAAAQTRVPFKGTMQGSDTDTCFSPGPPPIVCVTTNGKGIGSHVGQFTFTLLNTVNIANGTDAGSATLIAANGDTITTTHVGAGEPTADSDVISITEIYTITGGTGRFAGAQGSFIVERLANVVTFFTSGSFHGTITSPGAAH